MCLAEFSVPYIRHVLLLNQFPIREYSKRLVCLIHGNMCLAELSVPCGVRCFITITSRGVWRWMFSHIVSGKHLMAGQRLSTYSLPLHVFLLSYYLDWLHAFLLSFL